MVVGFGKNIKRIISVTLLALILFSTIMAKADEENHIKKNVTSHDIAIVFDNSGSMYDNTDRWSQALYAIGAFASMLDYEAGDKLGIYPMGKISIGRNGEQISDRLEITKDNIKDISKIYCKRTSETILKPAYSAKEYLKNSSANEKWLIILTDGKFYYDKSISEKKSKKNADWLSKKMLNLTGDGINVQYLGFAEASVLKSNVSNNFYASNVNSAGALTSELVSICNKIFQRHKIQDISDGEFSIDVSMNSIIAFVQGKGAEINSLNNNGKMINSMLNTKLNAGTEGTGSSYSVQIADISGQVVTFNDCESGTYNLNYTGSDIQVFYEPNVKIQSYITDKKGKTVDTSKSIIPGEYTLNYGLVDGVNGQDVSSSPLLSPINIFAEVSNNGKTQEVASGQTFNLEPDSETQVNISGTFLSEYEINNQDDETGRSLKVVMPKEKSLKVSMGTKQFDRWYKVSDMDNWKPVRVDVRYGGKKLSDEKMKNLKLLLTPKSSPELEYIYQPIKGESAFEIYLGKDENGKYVKPKCGEYELNAKATYKDEYGREIKNNDSMKFDIKWYSKFWLWLFWLIILLILAALIILVLNIPAWPAKMTCVIEKPKKSQGRFSVSPSGGTMRVVPFKYELSARVKKNSKLKDKFGKKASLKVVSMVPNKKIQSFTIGPSTYTKENKYLDSEGKPFQGIIRNGTQISMTFTTSEPLSARININK